MQAGDGAGAGRVWLGRVWRGSLPRAYQDDGESWFLWAALSKCVSSEGRGQSSRLYIQLFQQQQPP